MAKVYKYGINLSKREFYKIKKGDARFCISVRESSKMEIGSHIISINANDNEDYFHVGNWHFIKQSIFCDNYQEKGLRIEIKAKNLLTDNEYIFYGIDSYVEDMDRLAEYTISLIVEIAQNDTIEEFDNYSLNSKVKRM